MIASLLLSSYSTVINVDFKDNTDSFQFGTMTFIAMMLQDELRRAVQWFLCDSVIPTQ